MSENIMERSEEGQRAQMLEEKILKLEERMAYLEDELERSNAFIAALLDDCAALKDQVRILAVRQGEISAVCDLKDETPPPHY
ncbi:MAG: SlyX family protein [Proteobacteria bacterium]|uniref:SlyX family protein n=1 Tax=Candidatus Avisuccinivibrio stercorigallinarum TaxID=2840704 RepID=A0A9D9DBU0_9GAMM|nr:SlyX family protein [Candidatus Avisuccinivibrio stercorigallinarum]